MKSAVFFDRDGTLIENIPYLADPDRVVLRREAVAWVREARERGLACVVVTNQSGVARGLYDEKAVRAVNDRVAALFADRGAPLDGFYHCPHHPDFPPGQGTRCDCRKPAPGMILAACRDLGLDPARCCMVGDVPSDREASENAGLAAYFDADADGEALLRWIELAGPAIKRYSLFDRESLVTIQDFPTLPDEQALSGWRLTDHLPPILGGKALAELARALVEARRKGKLIGWAMGGHVVKTGLAPYVRFLIEKGYVSVLAVNGAFPIHDLEIALAGKTSEDVAGSLNEGAFGMARETGDAFARILRDGAAGKGFGAAAADHILSENMAHASHSILAKAREAGVPVCVFPALGAEITAMHPGHDGASLGRAAEIDFHALVGVLAKLDGGGVWLNVGSAVILPEVFLKALNLAINLHGPISGYLTANLDMIQHYRPRVNVVQRPGSQGIALTGHHEILIPLLTMALRQLDEDS